MYKVNISELKALKEALIRSNALLTMTYQSPINHSKIRRELKLIIKENEKRINELTTKYYI